MAAPQNFLSTALNLQSSDPVEEGYDLLDFPRIRQLTTKAVVDGLSKRFPISNDRHTLELTDVEAEEKPFSIKEQKAAIMEGRSLANKIKGRWALRDNATGQVISQTSKKIVMTLPWLTDRGTYVRNGHEYTLSHVMRLRPGVYSRMKANGLAEAQINVEQGTGVGMKLELDPNTGTLVLRKAGRAVKLAGLLKAMGVPREDMARAWGAELADANEKASGRDESKTYEMFAADMPGLAKKAADESGDSTSAVMPPGGLSTLPPPPVADLRTRLLDAFGRSKVDPESTSVTLGERHERVTPALLLASSAKLLKLSRGETDPDERDSLEFQRVHGHPDLFAERVMKDGGGIARKLLWKATNKGGLDFMPAGPLNDHVDSLFDGSSLAQYIEGSSPVDMIDNATKITRLGEGGLGDIRAAPASSGARAVHNSYCGFIDPIRTPESLKCGLDSFLTKGARKGSDGLLYNKFINARTGKEEWVSSRRIALSKLAMPDQWASQDQYLPTLVGSKGIDIVHRKDVDYILRDASDQFSHGGSLVPLKSGVKGLRLNMGSKYSSQSMPLAEREAPFVSAADVDGRPVEERFGGLLGVRRAKDAGSVEAVTKDHIKVRYLDGSTDSVELYDNFPANQKGFLRSEAAVKPGDVFKKGALLAGTNYTDKEGRAAFGRNLRVAWIPWKGSVSGDTMTLWYDKRGMAHYEPIENYRHTHGAAAVAVDQRDLSAAVLPVGGFSAHYAADILNIKLSSGRELRATENHSFVVLSSAGGMREVAGRDLIPGESLIPRLREVTLPCTQTEVALKYDYAKRTHVTTVPLDFDFGYIIGLYIAEGWIIKNKWGVGIAGVDAVLQQDLRDRLRRVFPDCRPSSNKIATSVFLPYLGLWLGSECGNGSHNKKIPSIAFCAPDEFRHGVVSGYLAGDGAISVKKNACGGVSATTVSRQLRDGLGLLLASLGIETTHQAYYNAVYSKGVAYSVRLSGRDLHKVRPFTHSEKWTRFEAAKNSLRDKDACDTIPIFDDAVEALNGLLKGMGKLDRQNLQGAVKRRTVRRAYALRWIPEDTKDPHLQQLRKLALAPIVWDRVVSRDLKFHGEAVYDFNMDPLNTFMCVDTIVVHNSNYEDGIAISEGAARKLAHETLVKSSVSADKEVQTDPDRYKAFFPGRFTADQFKTIGRDGLAKPGTILHKGDPVILSFKENEPSVGTLGRRTNTDHAEVWEHEYPGEVVEGAHGKDKRKVLIKAVVPTQVGDKISARHGGKGVITSVLPDSQMPLDADGKPYEVLMNPLGVITRCNPSTMIETALGKITERTGRRFTLPDFSDESHVDMAQRELAKAGLSDTEDLVDPETGRTVPKVFTGNAFFYKLKHLAEGKESGRGESGGYTQEEMPGGRGYEGSKRMGGMEQMGLVSHGAWEVIKDARLLRGQANEEFWRDIKMGRTPSMPSTPLTRDKFFNHLRSAGIHVKETPTDVSIFGMTGAQAREMSGGREVRSGATFDDKKFQPIKDGLFDPAVFGPEGDKFGYLKLDEPMPNPVMEDTLRRVLNLGEGEYNEIAAGKREYKGLTGGAALRAALDKTDLDFEIASTRRALDESKGARRDDAVKRLRALRSLKEKGVKPGDFMMDVVPVLPPKFRSIQQNAGMTMSSDANYLYKDLINARDDLAAAKGSLPDDMLGDARARVYDSYKALVGVAEPKDEKLSAKGVKGLLKWVFGDSPKMGGIQRKVFGGSVNMVGRGTIIPDHSLTIDQVGLPENQAWSIYEPFVVRELVQGGYPATDAVKLVSEKSKVAYDALQKVVKQRPVILNRAPSLHKFSIMGFEPVLMPGGTIRVNPNIITPFNADFDGDQQIGIVVVKFSKHAIGSVEARYGKHYLQERRMRSAKLPVPVKRGDLVCIMNLEDLPHEAEARVKRGAKGPIEFHPVMPGVEVLAYDDNAGGIVWAPVSHWSRHADRAVEVVELGCGRQIITDDDPRAVYGMAQDSIEFARFTPTEALKRKVMVPVARTMNVDEALTSINPSDYAPAPDGWRTLQLGNHQLRKRIELSREFGYALGVQCGDGWSAMKNGDISGQFYVAGNDSDIFEAFDSSLRAVFADVPPEASVHDFKKAEHTGRHGDSYRLCYSSRRAADLFSKLLGHKAANKHLPPFYLTAPREFRLGLFGGLMDTDGSISVSSGKKKPQLMTGFTSVSLRLCQEVKLLAMSLDIGCRLTSFKYRGNTAWQVYFSVPDVLRWGGTGMRCGRKLEKLRTMIAHYGSSTVSQQADMIPCPLEVASTLAKALLAKANASKGGEKRELLTLYAVARKAASRNSLLRASAERCVSLLGPSTKLPESWLRVLADKSVRYSAVVAVNKTGIRETGYDLTVPGYETFMSVDGVILSNTMQFHVPVSMRAAREVREKMLPSRNLLSVRSFQAHYLPIREYGQGLYLASRMAPGKPTKSFESVESLRKAYRQGMVDIDEPVRLVEGRK